MIRTSVRMSVFNSRRLKFEKLKFEKNENLKKLKRNRETKEIFIC